MVNVKSTNTNSIKIHTEKVMVNSQEDAVSVPRPQVVGEPHEVLMRESPLNRGQGPRTLAPAIIALVREDFSTFFPLLTGITKMRLFACL